MTTTESNPQGVGRGKRLKLKEEDVLHIRSSLAQKVPSRELARQYGCSDTAINNIGAHRVYAHFGGPKIVRKQKGTHEIEVVYNVEPKPKQEFNLYRAPKQPPKPAPPPKPVFKSPASLQNPSSQYLYRACRKCGIRIFDTLADALIVMPEATQANVSAAPLKGIGAGDSLICCKCKGAK